MSTPLLDSLQPGSRILFANFPADGHFNPLTGLAVHLKNKGYDVRWYTAVKYAARIGSLDIPFYPLKRARDFSADATMEQLFPEREKHKSQIAKLKFDIIQAFILPGPDYYHDILEIHEEFPFDLMIADITFAGIPFVKERMNLPVISVGVVPLPETSKDLPPSGLGLTPSYSVVGRWRQQFLRFLSDALIFAQPIKIMRQILSEYGIDAGKANIFDILIQKSTVMLQSGTPGFEYRRSDISPHIHFAGPLLPYVQQKNRQSWYDAKLKQYDKVILVTQGTVEQDAQKLLIPTLEALKDSNHLVIVTTGGTGTEELRKKYPQPNVVIEDFISFDDVMPHADVYITNGGYGGVLLSIQNELPLVVAGIHEGKNEINARVGYFKLGINLKTEKPQAKQILEAVEKILSNDVYRKNVQRLGREFRRYDPNQICEREVIRLIGRPEVETIEVQELVY